MSSVPPPRSFWMWGMGTLTMALSIGGRKLPSISTSSGASHFADGPGPVRADCGVIAPPGPARARWRWGCTAPPRVPDHAGSSCWVSRAKSCVGDRATWLAGDKVELVALGVEERDPPRAVLLDMASGGRAQREQTRGLGLQVRGDQVQVQPVLDRFRLGHLAESEPWTRCWITCVDYGGLGGGVGGDQAAQSLRPERASAAASQWRVGTCLGRGYQICARPPSTNSSMPVMKLESSEARNSAALGTSSGSPMRPIGRVDVISAIVSCGAAADNGVAIGPGLRTLERIRRSFSSTVHPRTKFRTAALLAP